jgi:hypothetical protein
MSDHDHTSAGGKTPEDKPQPRAEANRPFSGQLYFASTDGEPGDWIEQKIAVEMADALVDPKAIKDGQSLEQILRTMVDAGIEVLLRYYRLDPVFFHRYPAHTDEHDAEELIVSLRQPAIEEWFVSVLQHHAQAVHTTSIELAACIALSALDGALSAIIDEQPELLESEELRQELTGLLLRYLVRD